MDNFAAALSRKYDIMQQDSAARTRLESAQADAIPSTTASENALRGAQAYQTNQQGAQVAPLAQSQIGEAGARSGLYGAQGRLAGTKAGVQGLDLRNTGDALGGYLGGQLHDQLMNNRNGGVSSPNLPVSAPTPTGGTVNGTVLPSGSFDQGDPDRNRRGQIGLFGGSNPNVTEAGSAGYKKGTANVPGKGKAPQPKAAAGPGGGMASLMAALGQQGAPTAPGGLSGAPQAPPPQPGALPFMGGTAQVPGRGSGNVDKVPAMLAPHEAVLTHGAASALGRGKIAALNAAHPPTLPTKKKTPPLQRGMV